MAQNPSNVIPDQLIVVEGGKQLVPPPSSGDSGKVLGVLNSDGDIGWTEGASSSDIFVAKYGVTPYSEIAAAIADGKDVVCMYVDSDNVTYTYNMTQHDASNQFVRFAWLKMTSDRTTYHPYDLWYEITMQGTTWRDVSGPFPANLSYDADGSTIEATQSQNIVQFSVKNPLPASTSADADKVLTVNSSGTPEWATAQGGGGGGTTVGSDLKTVLHASAPVAKTMEQTFSGGTYPGETCFITSDDISGTVAAIKVPKVRYQFVSSASGLYNTTVYMDLYKNGTFKARLSSAKAKYYNRYYYLVFPEFWYIPSTPLAALETGERYTLVLSYNTTGSYNRPSSYGGSAQFFPYSDTERYIAPACTFSRALQPNDSYGMPQVSLRIDADKGINERETLDDYGSGTYKLSINNTEQAYDWDNYQEPVNRDVDRMEILVPLQDDHFSGDSGYQKRFPVARDFQKYGGQNHGMQDPIFSFEGTSLKGGDVFVVHIEAPATSTASGDHVAFCYFTLCETVEDWESGTNTQYYHNFVLPGIYRSNYGGKFMADGIITISGSHSNGMFSEQLYSGPDIVAMESGVTITPSYGVDGWNCCVSKI